MLAGCAASCGFMDFLTLALWGPGDVRAFLSELATAARVSASTQNQADWHVHCHPCSYALSSPQQISLLGRTRPLERS